MTSPKKSADGDYAGDPEGLLPIATPEDWLPFVKEYKLLLWLMTTLALLPLTWHCLGVLSWPALLLPGVNSGYGMGR